MTQNHQFCIFLRRRIMLKMLGSNTQQSSVEFVLKKNKDGICNGYVRTVLKGYVRTGKEAYVRYDAPSEWMDIPFLPTYHNILFIYTDHTILRLRTVRGLRYYSRIPHEEQRCHESGTENLHVESLPGLHEVPIGTSEFS